MSLYQDLPANVKFIAGYEPTSFASNQTGSTVDTTESDGDVFAVLSARTSTPEATLALAISESADGTTWSAISGASLSAAAVTATPRSISFTRTKRYLRCALTIAGEDAVVVASVLFGLPKKVI